MQRFRVTSPDGRTFTITAPDGVSRSEVLARAQAHATANPQTTKNTIGGLAGEYLDGILPGAAGAAYGAGETLRNAIRAPFSSSVDFHPRQSYLEGQAFQEARQKAARATHPYTAGALTGTGMVSGLLLPASKVARAATMGQKIAAGAKTAGAYGALSGALSSKAKDLGGVLSDTIASGETSALVGAGLPIIGKLAGAALAPLRPLTQPIVRMAGKGIGALGEILPGSVGALLSREGQQLARDPARATANVHLDRDIRQGVHPVTAQPLRPADLPAEVARRQALGVPAVAADVSDTLQGRMRSAARSPGPATMRVRNILDERKQQEAARTARHIAESLGPVTNVEQQASALNEQARAAARPLYDLSNAQPIPVTREMQEVFSRPAGRQAMNHAAVSLQNEAAPVLTDGLIENADGTWRQAQVPTMQAYDHAKTALDDQVFAGNSPFKSAETTRDTRGAHSVRARLLELMDGDGSGPRVAPAGRGGVPAAPAAPTVSPGVPGALGSRLAATGENDLGQWTGPRLDPEAPTGAPGGPAEGPASAIPPEGLNPFWKPARDAYAGPVMNRKALELGEDMAKSGTADVSNRMDGMTGSQLDHFRLGHRTALAADARALPDYADAARRLAGSEEQRGTLASVHGPEAAGALMDRLGLERDAAATWHAVRGGAGVPDLWAQDLGIEAGAQGLIQVLAGHPGAGIGNIVKAIARGDRGGQEINGHIAGVLSQRDVGALSAAMRDVGREKARRAIVERNKGEALQRGSRFLGGVLGTNMIAPVSDDAPAY